jgi:general secretion pathway protein D
MEIMKIIKMRFPWYLLVSVLILGSGCATTEMAIKPITLERPVQKPQAVGTEVAKERVPAGGAPNPPVFERTVPEKGLLVKEPIDPKRLTLLKEPVAINVEKMPLSDFIIYALGETLKVSFVLDQKVMDNKEPVTLSMSQAMPPDKALEIVLGLLEKYNLYVEEKAGALYILQKAPELKQPFDIRVGRDVPESPAPILQVVPLTYVRPEEIGQLIFDLYKVQPRVHPRRENVILLYGQASQIKQIIELIGLFDVPYIQGKKKIMFRLTYWQVDDFIRQISPILEGMGLSITRSPKEPGILFVPIRALRSLLVIAADDKSLKYVLEWKERLDTPEAAGTQEQPFTYIPKYSRASDLVKSIGNLYGITPAQQAVPAGAGPSGQPLTPQGLPPGQPAPVSIAGLKISADDSKNIIISICNPEVYRNILSLLKELDTPQRQVLIEATVAEFTLSDDLKYGLEWMLKGSGEGTSTLLSAFGVPTGPGLVYQFLSNSQNFNTLINAYAAQNKVNILSTPRLVVLDNQEATIQVGTDIPVITGSALVPAGSSILQSYSYIHTGVMLRVKPTINTEGLLTLNISQEVSEMGTNPPGISSPTIITRRITTSVVAAHGQSIGLGGLMQDTVSTAESKIPFLGDIPLIGYLFKTISKSKRRTELLVVLTPTILTSVDDAAKITKELKDELKWLK